MSEIGGAEVVELAVELRDLGRLLVERGGTDRQWAEYREIRAEVLSAGVQEETEAA